MVRTTGGKARRDGAGNAPMWAQVAIGAGIVNFDGFRDLVKAIGGVRMYVDEKVTSIHIGTNVRTGKVGVPFNINPDGTVGGLKPNMRPQVYEVGWHDFADWQALDYVRQRDLLANGDSDYGRQRHQQQFVKAVLHKTTSTGVITNPIKVNKVLKSVGKAVSFDLGQYGHRPGLTVRRQPGEVVLSVDVDDESVGMGAGTVVTGTDALDVVLWAVVGGVGVTLGVGRGDGLGSGLRVGTRRRVVAVRVAVGAPESTAGAGLRGGASDGLAEPVGVGSPGREAPGAAPGSTAPGAAPGALGSAAGPGIAIASGMNVAAAPPPASRPTDRTITTYRWRGRLRCTPAGICVSLPPTGPAGVSDNRHSCG